jgi:biopolymer transport protein ExbB/TolQ
MGSHGPRDASEPEIDVLVSGGISEALVTTALGLFAAIPAVMMFSYFRHQSKSL